MEDGRWKMEDWIFDSGLVVQQSTPDTPYSSRSDKSW
jgi:hypothetical protein